MLASLTSIDSTRASTWEERVRSEERWGKGTNIRYGRVKGWLWRRVLCSKEAVHDCSWIERGRVQRWRCSDERSILSRWRGSFGSMSQLYLESWVASKGCPWLVP